MKAEIISVGTELLLGQIVNVDAAIIARELSALGIDLLYYAVVGDNPQRLSLAIKEAINRSDILIMTGGLGPTQDDLTKETVAQVSGKKLTIDQESLKKLESYFLGKSLPENQKKQAMLPDGCDVLPNDNGTAPGCAFYAENGCRIFMLPGPPSELEPMLKNYAIPMLRKNQESVIVSHEIHVYGQGEAAVSETMADLIKGVNPSVAPYAKEGEMFLRVTAKAKDKKEAESMCAPVIEQIRERLGSFVYGIDVETLEHAVVELLKEKGKKLTAAESCTGGLLAKRITDISGSSEVLDMSFVTYSNDAKTDLVYVPEETINAYGAVSRQTACAMARGAFKRSGSDLGIGITGIAGPQGATEKKPVGTVYIALNDGKNTWVKKRSPFGRSKSREWHRHCAVSEALNMVRLYLTGRLEEYSIDKFE